MCAVMATRDEGTGLPIGEVLKRTRTRRKVDIHTVEQQTKIRTKYLRALENEEWDVLPGPGLRQGLPADLRAVPRPRRGRPGRRVPPDRGGGAPGRPRLWVPRAGAGAPPATWRGAAAQLGRVAVGRRRLGGGRRGPARGPREMAGPTRASSEHHHNGKHHAHHHGNGGSANQGGGSEQAGHSGAGHAGRHGGLPGDGRRPSR